jgi:hypothetical protein
MPDAGALIQKHQSKGVLVDTNLLVLLLVSLLKKQRIATFKRTGNFTVEDLDTLGRLIQWFGRLITTPHVLAQVSDLTSVPGKDLATIRRIFGSVVDTMEERFESSKTVVSEPLFSRLGLTDAAIGQGLLDWNSRTNGRSRTAFSPSKTGLRGLELQSRPRFALGVGAAKRHGTPFHGTIKLYG